MLPQARHRQGSHVAHRHALAAHLMVREAAAVVKRMAAITAGTLPESVLSQAASPMMVAKGTLVCSRAEQAATQHSIRWDLVRLDEQEALAWYSQATKDPLRTSVVATHCRGMKAVILGLMLLCCSAVAAARWCLVALRASTHGPHSWVSHQTSAAEPLPTH